MELALNNLRQSLRDTAARLGLPAFWSWWTGELAALTPAAPRAAVQKRRLRPIVAFGDTEAVLWEPRVVDGASVLTEAGRVSLVGDAAAVAQAGRAMLDALPRPTSGAGAPKVVIALPRAQVLRKQFTLPAAVEEHLRDALTYDLDRHTPFRGEQLYFDAVIIARDPVKKEIRVDWAAALRTTVDAARRNAESWGALVVGVTPESPEPASAAASPRTRWSKLNLLPRDHRPDIVLWRRPQFLVPAALLAVALLVATVLPIWQKRDYAIALSAIADQARAQAEASDALREQVDQATGDYNFALGRKYQFPSAVQLLDDVTKILPDDTWLTQLEVKSMPKGKEPHREIVLRGESANAGLLVSALEGSKLFEQAAPRSPTTKIQPGPGEVFDLGAQLKALPPPEPIKLVSVAPAAGAPVRGAAPPAANVAPPAAVPAPANGVSRPEDAQGGGPAVTGVGAGGAPPPAPAGTLPQVAPNAALPPAPVNPPKAPSARAQSGATLPGGLTLQGGTRPAPEKMRAIFGGAAPAPPGRPAGPQPPPIPPGAAVTPAMGSPQGAGIPAGAGVPADGGVPANGGAVPGVGGAEGMAPGVAPVEPGAPPEAAQEPAPDAPGGGAQ